MAEFPSTPSRPQTTNANLEGLKPDELVRFWGAELAKAKNYFKNWFDTCDRIVERYRDERGRNDGVGHRTSEGGRIQTKRYNILWSNVNTLFPALYTEPPSPEVRRRYKDDDPLGRLAVEINERVLQFCEDPADDEFSYDSAMRCAVLDYLLIGRGVTWVRYEREETETTTEAVTRTDEETGEEIVVAEAETMTEVTNEAVRHEHIQYRDFLHTVAPTWDKVLQRGWVARRHYFTRPEVKALTEELSAAGATVDEDAWRKVQLTVTDTSAADGRVTRDGNERKGRQPMYAEVWEIWNKPDKKVYYVAKSLAAPIAVQDDPLNLINFFPCPRPVYATTTPDTLIPVPDYVEYYDQAENLDRITDQKWKLTTAVRVAGFYAGNEAQAMQQVFDGSNRNVMIPVQDWAQIQGQGGVRGLIEWVPLDVIVGALEALQRAEEANKQQIYEITGIADIVRGQSKASETLGAQRIKGQWASVRISDRQREVAAFCRDTLRIDSEIVLEHYDAATIAQMTNFTNSQWAQRPELVAAFNEAVALLKDDRARTYRVDVETEDTVFADETQEKSQNIEMLAGMGELLSGAAEIAAAQPLAVPMLGEMLKIGVKSFSGSQARRLEMAVDEFVDAVNRQTQDAMQNPQPSPEEMEAQAQAQKDAAEAQDKQAGRQLEAQGQVLDFRAKMADQATQRRGQDMQFASARGDRLAQLLSRAASGA